MKREKLLRWLQEAVLTEESAIPIYAKHLPNTLFWSGLAEKDIGFIKAGLRRLAVDSERHRKTLEGLMKKVREDESDVF